MGSAAIGLIPRPLHSPDELRARFNARFRAAELASLPSSVARAINEAASARDEALEDYRVVNGWVRRIAGYMKDAPLAFDEAVRESAASAQVWAAHHRPVRDTEGQMLSRHGIEPPRDKRISTEARARRYRSTNWWKQRLARMALRRYEDGARAAGLVGRRVSPYISEATLHAYRENRRRLGGFLESMEAQNTTTGEVLPLKDLAELSLANPAHRSAELMVKARGYEDFARSRGHSWIFAVVTAPSRFHRTLYEDGAQNKKWDGSGVRDGQAWHQDNWRLLRALAARKKLPFYGLRTVEPHSDGTVHWNLLLFADRKALQWLAHRIRKYWLADCPDEAGAQRRRVKVVYEDQKKGSAASYVAKYITKGTSGEFLEGDRESDLSDGEAAERVRAWAIVHGIRQFQFIGCLKAAIWRELHRYVKRFRDAPVEPTGVPEIDRLLVHATGHVDYGAYLAAQGYVPGRRDTAACLDYKGTRYKLTRRPDGREEIAPALDRWGDRRPDQIEGLLGVFSARQFRTRQERWIIQSIARALCIARSGVSSGPWTCSTNCNHWIDIQRWLSREGAPATGPPDITVGTGIWLDGVEIHMTKPVEPPPPLPADAPLTQLYLLKLDIARRQYVLGEVSDDEVAIAEEKYDLAKRYDLVNEGLRILGQPEHSREQLIYSIETIGTPDPELGW